MQNLRGIERALTALVYFLSVRQTAGRIHRCV